MTDSIRVLHVDDEPGSVDEVANFLRREDDRINVLTATTASEGLDRLAATDVDCVVSGYEMPGTNGLEFLDAVREEYPDLPFILLTGKGSEELASEAISRGVTDYFQKGGTEKGTLLAQRILNAVHEREAQRRDRRTGRRFQKLVERTNNVICVVDSAGVFDYVSPAAERVLGYPGETLVGENGFDYVHPDDRDATVAAFEAMVEGTEHSPTVEFRFQHGDGSWIWVEAHGRNLLEDPDVGGIVVTARDVTARKEHETALQTERDRRGALFEQLGEPVVEVSFDGEAAVVRTVNTAFEETFGVDRSTIVGVSLDEAIVPDEDRETARALNRQAKAGEVVESEIQRETPEGPRTFLFRSVPFTLEDEQRAYGIYVDVTERKRQEERFRTYIEQSTDIITVLNPDGTYQYQSPSSERILGYAPEELVGENAFEYVHPDDREEVMATFEDAVADPSVTPIVEYRFRHADGAWRWFESIGNNQLSNPAVEGFVVNSRDVTERKRRERQLHERNAKLETLHDVAAEIDQYESADAVFDRLIAATEEILEFDNATVDVPEDRADGTFLVPTAMSSEVAEDGYSEETPVGAEDNLAARVHRTGEVAVVDDLGESEVASDDPAYRSALTVPIGEHGVFQAVKTDLGGFDETDRTLTRLLCRHVRTTLTRLAKERHLRERERRLETIRDRMEFALEATNTLIWVLDLGAGDGVTIHGPVEELFGTSPEAMADAESLSEVGIHADDVSTLERKYEQVVDGQADTLEAEFRTAPGDGETRWLNATAFTHQRDDGSRQLIGLSTDVTEQKHRERELERQNDRLDEFASVVSHDLRNPIEVANAGVKLAGTECDSDHLAKVEDALTRMEAIIDDTLTLARQSRAVGEMEPVDLASLASRCWGIVETADAELRNEDALVIRADLDRMQHVLENLFRNAIDHGDEDVTIRVGRIDDDGLYVEDTGPGIPEGEREAVFEPGHTTAAEGTGFGLTIVRRIVEAHGWDVRVTDGEAGGARFEITGVDVVDERNL